MANIQLFVRSPTARFYLVASVTIFIILYLRSELTNLTNRTIDNAEIFRLSQMLKIDGMVDPLCNWSYANSALYLCSGFCPLAYRTLQRCLFLPRIIHTDFQKLGMYCRPPEDKCPDYNVWLKDGLPLTREPIRKIPDNIVANFTLNGMIKLSYNFGFMFKGNSTGDLQWTAEYIEGYRKKVRAREPFGTYNSDALYPVLDEYGALAVARKKTAVIGSEFPWIEAALLENGATSVTTIEYTRINVINVPRLSALTPAEYIAKQYSSMLDPEHMLFDSIWSYSSIEHDGLGRYTDPIHPYGDFLTMTKISCMLKPGGFLFLAVPTNYHDEIHFNLHRVYGPVRYPILYRNFHLIRVFADRIPNSPGHYGFQPIVVLQNKIGCM